MLDWADVRNLDYSSPNSESGRRMAKVLPCSRIPTADILGGLAAAVAPASYHDAIP